MIPYEVVAAMCASGVVPPGMAVVDGLPRMSPSEAMLEVALIGRAIQEANREIGQRSFGAAIAMPDAEMMRIACRALLRLQREERERAEHQEAV